MKTLFKGKGKLVLTCLIALCAVLISCAVLLCSNLLNKENRQTAKEDTTTIEAPDLNITPQYIWSKDRVIFDSPAWESASGTNLEFCGGDNTLYVAYRDSSDVSVTLNEPFFNEILEYPVAAIDTETTTLPSECYYFDDMDGGYIKNINKLNFDTTYQIGIKTTEYYDLDQNTYSGWWSDYTTGTKYLYVIRQPIKSISPTLTYGTVTWGTTSAAPTLTGNTNSGKVTYSVSSGTGSATIDSSTGKLTPVTAGTVTVTASIEKKGDCMGGTARTTVTIQRKAIAIPTLSLGSGVHATATANGQSATTTYNGGVQHFTISSTTNITFGTPTSGATRSGSDFYATNARSSAYTVTMTIDGTKYCWGTSDGGSAPSSKTLSITINKATPNVTITAPSGTYYIGNTLSTVGLTGNSNGVGGTFTWSKPTTVLTASGSYEWKFTPTDTTNYNTVTDSLTVVAVAKLTGITVTGAKTTYKAYESFTTAGMKVTVNGGGGSTTVTDYTYTVGYGSDRNYFLVSDNGCTVTVSYTEGDVTKTASFTITVTKADYDMTGVAFNNVTTTYDGEPHSITLLSTSLPTGVTLVGYTYDGVTGTSKTDAGRYVVAPVFTIADSANYNMPTMSATLLIDKATPVVSVSVSDGTFYVGDNLSTVAISLESANVPGTLDWTTPTSKLSGLSVQYGWTFKPEDNKNYNNATGNVTVVAVYKLSSIEVTGGTANYSAFDELDEDSIVITATYASGKSATTVTGWTYKYPGSTNYFTVSDDGKKVTFTYTENKITKTCTLTVTVGKKTVDMTGVSMTNANETYTGNPYSIEISGTLPEVLELNGYLYNDESATSATDAGTYVVKAQFTLKDTANYVMPELSATLTIGKATPVITVTGVETNYTYNGALQTVNSGATVNNTEQTVEYKNNTFTTVAEGNNHVVTISVKESKNYKAGSETVTLTVEKAELSLTWTGGDGAYDGKEHNATLTVASGVFTRDKGQITTAILKNHITVTYTTEDGDDARIKVGTYAPAYTGYPDSEPFCNYTPVLTNEDYTFEITADEVTGISFTGATFAYDGKNHVIAITGTLPSQVTVKYYYKDTTDEFTGVTDVKRDNGEVVGYEITAVFECESGNYEAPEALTATIKITPRTISANEVGGIETTYTYKGEAWEPVPVVTLTLTGAASSTTLVKDADYTVEYSTADYDAGTSVDVVVKGVGNYTGTVTKTFTIEKATISMEWVGTTFTYTGKGQGVTPQFSGIAESDKDTVVPEVKYVGRGGTDYAESTSLPVNAGYYTVTVSLDLTSDNYESTIVNGIFKHFEIKKAELSVSVGFVTYKQGDTVYAGSSMPDIEISSPVMFEGKLVKGEVSWQKTGNAPATLKQGTNDYVWIFTPDDQTNFAQSNGKLTVWNAIPANISGIVVAWNTTDGEQPDLFTSTTLEKVREYLTVTGTLETSGTVEVADYNIIGSWGTTESPETGGTYFFTITTSDEKFTELMNGIVYDDVLLMGITVKPVTGGEIKKTYEAFDTFNKDGVIVTAEYNDGAKIVITDYTVTYPDGKDCFWAKENEYQSLTISYEDCKPEIISGITVNKKSYDASKINFDKERTETYSGTSKAYGIKGTFDIGTVTYTYAKWNGEEWAVVPSNSIVNAGTYKITAHFNIKDEEEYTLNYEEVEDMESVLTIKKAVCNVDELVFVDTDCDYAYGKSVADKVSVNVKPDGVTKVEYEYRDSNGKKIDAQDVVNAGEYTVSVKFTVDENHEPIALDPVKLTINKVSPKINPTVSGSLTEGVKLYELTFVNADGDTAGKFAWDNADYALKAGINRCYYTFTPDDTSNFKTYRGYVDLTAGAGAVQPTGNTAPDALIWVTVAIVIVVLLVALIALVVAVKASKRPASADGDGFYDRVTDEDLQ